MKELPPLSQDILYPPRQILTVQKQSNMTTACRTCSQPATWTPEIQLKEKREQRTAMLCNMAMHNERWRSVGKDWNEKEGGITTVLLIRAAHHWAVPYCYYKYMNICLVYLGYLDFRKRITAFPSIAIAVPRSLTWEKSIFFRRGCVGILMTRNSAAFGCYALVYDGPDYSDLFPFL